MSAGNRQQRTAEEREQARLEREARRGRAAKPARTEVAQSNVGPVSQEVDSTPLAFDPEPDSVDHALAVAESSPGGIDSDLVAVDPGTVAVDSDLVAVDPDPVAVDPHSVTVDPGHTFNEPGRGSLEPVALEHPTETALVPIPVKLPPPAPLPPRLPPPRTPGAPRGRWGARFRAGTLLLAVAVVLGGLVAFVLLRSKATAKPPAPIAVVSVTIPEGETAAQIAQLAKAKGLTGSYLKAARHSALLAPAHYGARAGTRNLEGFLFPATYEMYAGAPACQLLARAAHGVRRKLWRRGGAPCAARCTSRPTSC